MLARWPLGSYAVSHETTFGSCQDGALAAPSVVWFSYPTVPSGSVAAIASNAAWLIAILIMRSRPSVRGAGAAFEGDHVGVGLAGHTV